MMPRFLAWVAGMMTPFTMYEEQEFFCFFVFWGFFLMNLFILFIYFWLRWVFVAVRRLSLVVASGGYSPLRGLLLAMASFVAEHRL